MRSAGNPAIEAAIEAVEAVRDLEAMIRNLVFAEQLAVLAASHLGNGEHPAERAFNFDVSQHDQVVCKE